MYNMPFSHQISGPKLDPVSAEAPFNVVELLESSGDAFA